MAGGSMNEIKISSKFITVGKDRIRVQYYGGPWVDGVPKDLIKIRPACGRSFPQGFHAAFAVKNESDIITDYFVRDEIRLLPDHRFYDQVKAFV